MKDRENSRFPNYEWVEEAQLNSNFLNRVTVRQTEHEFSTVYSSSEEGFPSII